MRAEDLIVIAVLAAVFALYYLTDLAALLGATIESVVQRLASHGASQMPNEFIGAKVRVVETRSDGFTVEFKGAPWRARPLSADFTPKEGEFVVIRKMDGIVLFVERDV